MVTILSHCEELQKQGWNWTEDVKAYRRKNDERAQELLRHSQTMQREVIRNPDMFPHLKTKYVRGLNEYDKVSNLFSFCHDITMMGPPLIVYLFLHAS